MWSQSMTRWGICTFLLIWGCTALKVQVEPVQIPIEGGSGNPAAGLLELADSQGREQGQLSQGQKITGGPGESWIGALTKVWAGPASIHSKSIGGHSERVLGFRQASQHTTHQTKKTLKDHASHAKQLQRISSNNSAQAVMPQQLRSSFNETKQTLEDHVSHEKQPPRLGSNNSAQAVNGQPLLSFQIQGNFAAPSVTFATEIAAIVICMVLLACVISWYVDSLVQDQLEDLDESPKHSNEDSLIIAGSISKAMTQQLPRTHEDLVDGIDGHDGTWARNYRGADGKYRDALELLYRCGIIPPQEFACSRVRQDHIEECVWIATYMLRQRPLEEWALGWAEAQVKFEESVLACFTARTDVLETPSPSPNAKQREPVLESHAEGSTSPNYSTYWVAPKAAPPVSQKIAEDLVLRSRDSTGQNLLIMRCREIMAKHKGQQPLMEQECYVQCSGGDIQPLMAQEDAWHQSQFANPDIYLDCSPRVTLKVIEQVVPSPRPTSKSSLGEPAVGLTRQPSMPMSPTWQPAGSSAACSTSAYHTMNPELGEKWRM